MKLREEKCFVQTDDVGAEHGYRLTFIQSGFRGTWIKVSECSDYDLNVGYASEEENEALNKLEKK